MKTKLLIILTLTVLLVGILVGSFVVSTYKQIKETREKQYNEVYEQINF